MILVTGASGQLGGQILRGLRSRGVGALGGSRSPKDEGVRFIDFDRPESVDFRGVATVVLVSAGYAEDDVVIARHHRIVDAAARDGVQHVVYTSLVGEGDHLGFALAHRRTEELIMNGPLSWTILRNGLYAELIGGLFIWDEGRPLSPFGSGVVAAPSREDLAEAAVVVAMDPLTHAGRVYELTAPAFRPADIVERLDFPVTDLPLGAYRAALLKNPDFLPFQPPMLVSIASAIRHGFLGVHHEDLAILLGRTPVDGLATALAVARASIK